VGKRLFVAVDIDESTRAQIERISSAVRAVVEKETKASWVHPDRMHLTLHFLGNVDAAMEERVRGTLAHMIDEAGFDITFDRLGFFPERGSPRVLWLGVRDGLDGLRRVHERLARELDLRPDHPGPFTPHLTLARLRDRVPRVKVAQISRIPASAGPSRIDRVTLYESRLSPAGPTYVPLVAAPLRP
jgi:RNA 2',3'-cyclic 3'-phosphodiesterase